MQSNHERGSGEDSQGQYYIQKLQKKMIQSQYNILDIAGSGNFSSVHKAIDNTTGKTVAIKIMKSHQKIGMRQCLLLKSMDHPNIIKLHQFHQDHSQTKMVLQFMPENTLQLYQSQCGLTQQQTKCVMFQSALGLAYIHHKGIIHRDIKPENILIDKTTAQTKLIDFGLAVGADQINTDYVATRWYRAPQNLLGTKEYTTAIDVFSLACVAVQLYLGQPLFPGSDNLDQLYRIFNVLGEPNQDMWPKGAKKFRQLGFKFTQKPGLGLDKLLKSASQPLIDLIKKMLILDPSKRITSWQILDHPFFKDVHTIVPPASYKFYLKQNVKRKKGSIMAVYDCSKTDGRKHAIGRSRQNLQRNEEESKKHSPRVSNVEIKEGPSCSGNDCGISFRGHNNFLRRDKQTHRDKDKQKTQHQSPTPMLSFRGFNPVKAAKIPVKETARMNNHNPHPTPDMSSYRQSRNNSIDSKHKKVGSSIQTLKRMIRNAGDTSAAHARKISADAAYGVGQRVPLKSTQKGNILYNMQESVVQRGNVPYAGTRVHNGRNQDNSMSFQNEKSNRIMTVNQEQTRLTRHMSEVNPHSQRMNPTDQKMPNFIRQRMSPPPPNPPAHPHLHSPNPIKPQHSPPPLGKDSIYTSSFSKQFKKLKVMMAPQRKDHLKTDRSPQHSFNNSRVVQTRNIPSTIEQRKQYKPNHFMPLTQFNQFNNQISRLPMALSPLHSYRGRNPGQGLDKAIASPESKIKLVKSLQHGQNSQNQSKIFNPSPNSSIIRKQSLNQQLITQQKQSRMLNQSKDYQPSKISIRKTSNEQIPEHLSFLRSNHHHTPNERNNKNININLSLNFVENQKRRTRI